jgi:uncharacterized protein (DUF433 family)
MSRDQHEPRPQGAVTPDPPEYHALGPNRSTACNARRLARSLSRRPSTLGESTHPSRRYNVAVELLNRITLEPGKRSGKPCIRGMRITVQDVLSYLAAGMTYEAVLADFPELVMEDILASLAWAAQAERRTLVAS